VRGNLEIPYSLTQFLSNQKIDAVFLNYISSWSLVESLGLNKYPVICEMHDIQSYQYAFYGKRDIDELEFQLECELLDKCDVVLVNNYKEIEKIRDFVKKPFLQYTPYIGRLSPVKMTDLDGCNTLIDMLRVSGAERVNDTEQNLRLSQAKSLDLLFVSSHHAPNIYSLKWFFHEVYLPYLAEHGVNLLIAGNIMNFCDLEEINHSQVFIAGVVENLRPLYAATRLVILPIKMGAGFNIKTIEALTISKPVVATSVAMRGIEFNTNEFPVFDDPKAYAEGILALLAQPQARLKQAKRGFEISQSQHSQSKYDQCLNTALKKIIPDQILIPEAKITEDIKPHLIEWCPEINLLLESAKFNFDLFSEHPEIYFLLTIISKFKFSPEFGQLDFCEKLYQSMMNFKLLGKRDIYQQKNLKNSQIIEKRICIIVPQEIRFYYPTVKLVADELIGSGFYVDIFCIEFGKISEIEMEHKFNVINYEAFWNYRQNYEIGRLEFLANAISKLGCYDVYIGVNYLGVAVANFMSERFKKLSVAYMFELFEDKSEFGQYIEDVCVNKIDAFIDVDVNRLNYRNKTLNLPKDSFYIRNVPTTKDITDRGTYSSKLGTKLVLWYHGTISTDHGIEELLEGYCKCKSDVELHLTGPILEIPSKEFLLHKIHSASKPVFIHDPLPRKEVIKKALELADIAICFYPFRNPNILDYWNRIYANPAKVFDYMALGIPTITSDNPSLIDYVQNEGWGLCVPPEDPDAVADAIDFLVEQNEMRLQMSKKARKLFLSKYNLEEEVKPFIDWLNKKLSPDDELKQSIKKA
jgi:glycosyltransferase involved in cell wall biosynthesis